MKPMWAIAVALMLVGCDDISLAEKATTKDMGSCGYLSVVRLEEHDYVVARGGNGICVIHAQSCPCMKQSEVTDWRKKEGGAAQ
jgi:hypothetical protein